MFLFCNIPGYQSWKKVKNHACQEPQLKYVFQLQHFLAEKTEGVLWEVLGRIRCPKCHTSLTSMLYLPMPFSPTTPSNFSSLISFKCVLFLSWLCVGVCACVFGKTLNMTPILPVCDPGCRLCECTEAEAEIILQLKNELREKELKLTDIRLEALSSAHHLDQIREAMNRMQVRLKWHVGVYISMTRVKLEQHV